MRASAAWCCVTLALVLLLISLVAIYDEYVWTEPARAPGAIVALSIISIIVIMVLTVITFAVAAVRLHSEHRQARYAQLIDGN